MLKKEKIVSNNLMEDLLNDDTAFNLPKVGDLVQAKVISVGSSEVYLDINGVVTGLVRGRELKDEAGQYGHLKPGDEVTATVLDLENEKGILELSLRSAGHKQAWQSFSDLKSKSEIVEVKVLEANKGGLMVGYDNIIGFMPVSQLGKENYPRVEGGNKAKILEKLKLLVGQKLRAKLIDLDERENKIIFSEKEVYANDKREELKKYQVGDIVDCKVTGIVDFGIFVEFGAGLEGLIHISELAWQRINHPSDLYQVGSELKVQIISLDDNRVTLSAKKLVEDPWKKAAENYQVGQIVKGKVLKFDKIGAFVELPGNIHGLAHISELSNDKIESPEQAVNIGEEYDFKILSIDASEHRMGLSRKDLENK